MGIKYDMPGMAYSKRIYVAYVDYQQPLLQCLTSQDLSVFIYMWKVVQPCSTFDKQAFGENAVSY